MDTQSVRDGGWAPVLVAMALILVAPHLAIAQSAALTPTREHALKPKDTFRECQNCPEMVVLPSGSFTMGSPPPEADRAEKEGPQHVVTIAKPFAVGRYPVTVGEFAAFVKDAGPPPGDATCQSFMQYLPDPPPAVPNGPIEYSWQAMGYKQTDRFPVACMSWNDAEAYVTWLAKKTGHPYRLLSEAEWEYAARASTAPGAYPPSFFGTDQGSMCRYVNGADQALAMEIRRQTLVPEDVGPQSFLKCDDGYAFASPVGSLQPNGFGLYDMHGNLTQWVADCSHDNYAGAPSDGSAWTERECEYRVMRGGSWNDSAAYFRDAIRFWNPPTQNGPDVGFRVARTLD